MKVLKFGGSSLASAARFAEVAHIVHQQSLVEPLILVLSAPQGVTNSLLRLVEQARTGADCSADLQQLRGRLQELVEAALCLLELAYHRAGNLGQLSGAPHLLLQKLPPSRTPAIQPGSGQPCILIYPAPPGC